MVAPLQGSVTTRFSRGGAGFGTQTSGPRVGGSVITVDFTDLLILAKQLSGNGPIPRKIQNAAERAVVKCAKAGKRRLSVSVNNNADAFRTPGMKRYFRTRGKRIRPYALVRPDPIPKTLAKFPHLVNRLTSNMKNSIEIEIEPRKPGVLSAEARVGWDTAKSGAYIEAVLLGTEKMRARDVLSVAVDESGKKCDEILRQELGLMKLFVPGDRSLTFVGFQPALLSLLTGGEI